MKYAQSKRMHDLKKNLFIMNVKQNAKVFCLACFEIILSTLYQECFNLSPYIQLYYEGHTRKEFCYNF